MPSPDAIHILFEIHVGLRRRRRSRARRRLRIGRALRRRFRLRALHRHFQGLRRCLHLLSTMLSTPSDSCGTPSPTPCPICTSKMWGYCCGVNGRCALILTLCCRETPQQYPHMLPMYHEEIQQGFRDGVPQPSVSLQGLQAMPTVRDGGPAPPRFEVPQEDWAWWTTIWNLKLGQNLRAGLYNRVLLYI